MRLVHYSLCFTSLRFVLLNELCKRWFCEFWLEQKLPVVTKLFWSLICIYEIKLPSQVFLDGRSSPWRKLRQVGCCDVAKFRLVTVDNWALIHICLLFTHLNFATYHYTTYPWRVLPYNGWRKVDIFNHLPIAFCKHNLWTTPNLS